MPAITRSATASLTPAAKRRKLDTIETYHCSSCDGERGPTQFPDLNPASECEHLINTCKQCLKQWIEAQVDSANFTIGGPDGDLFGIRCPECDVGIMKNVNIGLAAPKKLYARFEALERKHIADTTPNWRWCLAPGCDAGQVYESQLAIRNEAPSTKSFNWKDLLPFSSSKPEGMNEKDVCTCAECGAKACVPCDRPWHSGESCAEYQLRIKDRVDEEDQTLKAIRKVTKNCPKCRKHIQKNGGCRNMLCSQCGTTFCWTCLTAFEKGYCKCTRRPT